VLFGGRLAEPTAQGEIDSVMPSEHGILFGIDRRSYFSGSAEGEFPPAAVGTGRAPGGILVERL
jgi:hypothetical protein